MFKKSEKNLYLRQLKNGKLKLFFRMYLKFCGKKDAKNKVVREDENGLYSSPFINYEVHLYKLAIREEEERLIKSLISVERGINVFRIQRERKEELASNNSDIAQTISILKSKELELGTLKQKEEEISKLRNEQLYNMLQAIISVYWSGALQGSNDDPRMPPKVAIDHLI